MRLTEICSLFVLSFLQITCSGEIAGDGAAKGSVFEYVQGDTGTVSIVYRWSDPAVVYQVAVRPGQLVRPGRLMCVLKFKAENAPARSKAHLEAGASFLVESVNIRVGDTLRPGSSGPLMVLRRAPLSHDSSTRGIQISPGFRTLVASLWRNTGIRELIYQTGNDWILGIGRIVMILVGLLLIFLAIFKSFEPLLLLPIGFGAIMANIPLAYLSGPDGILGMIYNTGVSTGVFPLFIFMGVGAMTDFGPLIANPWTAILGAAAQIGIFGALLGALALSVWVPGIDFTLSDAASIGIIGGADGPTAIFLAGRLSPNLLGAIAVSAYSYMALVPVILPPIMKTLTTKEERAVKMEQLRPVSRLEKILFPISITLLCALLLPDASPLIGMLMFGNLMQESKVVDRLSKTAQHSLINIVTICLGLAVGSKLSADKFLNLQTVGILALGLIAFCLGTAGGVLLGKLACRISGGRVNPLIGAAGVSAVPMAARVVNKVGLEEDHHNVLLMHAMGPNVAGVIGSAVAAGVLLNALKVLS